MWTKKRIRFLSMYSPFQICSAWMWFLWDKVVLYESTPHTAHFSSFWQLYKNYREVVLGNEMLRSPSNNCSQKHCVYKKTNHASKNLFVGHKKMLKLDIKNEWMK